ncbi:MAG: hypothetical protein ACFE9S_15620 [Candidatus Hermodarchaeota archaeon]
MSEKEIDVFKFEKPTSFGDLLVQSQFIWTEIQRWVNKLRETIVTALTNKELISENNTEDTFHNLSQNIIELCELIQKKVRGE